MFFLEVYLDSIGPGNTFWNDPFWPFEMMSREKPEFCPSTRREEVRNAKLMSTRWRGVSLWRRRI